MVFSMNGTEITEYLLAKKKMNLGADLTSFTKIYKNGP